MFTDFPLCGRNKPVHTSKGLAYVSGFISNGNFFKKTTG